MINQFQLRDINPLRGLTEARLVSIMDAGERGEYAYLQWLYRFIEKRNPTARAVKRRLLAALGSLDWSIQVEDTGEDAEATAMAERQADTLRAAYARIGNLREALGHLAIAELRGFAHCEKIYRCEHAGEGEDPWEVIELRVVPQWFFCRDGIYGPWQYNRFARQGVFNGEPLERRADGRLAKFVMREIDDPANEIIAKVHVRQDTSDADWDGYLEDYGVPPMFVEMPLGVPQDKEAEYQAMAEKALSRARGAFPNGAKLHSPSATGSGGASIFRDRLEYLDGQIVIAGTSGKLTILSESGSGTLSGGAQKDAFDEIAQAIALLVSETMQTDFDAVELERLHPGEPILAYFEFAAVDKEDTSKVLDDAGKAFTAGYAMDEAELSERSGYKLSRLPAAPGLPTPPNEATPQGQLPSARAENLKPENESTPAPPKAVGPEVPSGPATVAAVGRELRVTPEFLAPGQSVFDELLAKAADGEVSDAELLASAEELLAALPALAAQTDSTGLADSLQAALLSAVESTLTGSAA